MNFWAFSFRLFEVFRYYTMAFTENPNGLYLQDNQNTITSFFLALLLMWRIFKLQDVALASLLIRPTPVLAIRRAKFIATSEDFTKVPRVYIKTLQDRVLLLDKQEAMIKMWPLDKVLSMDTDHSPFFSSPLELHRHLLYIAKLFAG